MTNKWSLKNKNFNKKCMSLSCNNLCKLNIDFLFSSVMFTADVWKAQDFLVCFAFENCVEYFVDSMFMVLLKF